MTNKQNSPIPPQTCSTRADNDSCPQRCPRPNCPPTLRNQGVRCTAVRRVLKQGYRTADIHETGSKKVGTDEMGDAVVAAVVGQTTGKTATTQTITKT